MNQTNKPSSPRHFCPLFADIFGSRQLGEKLGQAESLHAIERCFNRMQRAIATFKGRLVKHSGDQLMAAFDTAEDAMHAACEMQTRIESLPAVSGVKLAIGIGFHYGPVQDETSDVYGDTVNVAARLVKQAKGGQILTSAVTVEALTPLSQKSARALESTVIKVDREEVRIFAVLWQKPAQSLNAPTMPAPVPAPLARPQDAPATRLRLLHNGCEYLLGVDKPAVTLGRDAHSDLVIRNMRASRHHSRIEKRHDAFVLVDRSTNGTYLTPDGETGFLLKHGEAVLKGRGCISFGPPARKDPDSEDVVTYEVL